MKTKQNTKTAFKELSEAEIQNQVMQLLLLHNFLVIRFNSGKIRNHVKSYRVINTGKSEGLPDVIAFKKDFFLMTEIKDQKGKLRESQKEFIAAAERSGVKVHVINDLQQLIEIIQTN